MKFPSFYDLGKKIEEINPGFDGTEFVNDMFQMHRENGLPDPTMDEVWLAFLENKLDRDGDGMDIGQYLLQYTTHTEDMETIPFLHLQHAIVHTLLLAEMHKHDGDLNIFVTYSDYPHGNLTHVYQYTHNMKFNFGTTSITFEY